MAGKAQAARVTGAQREALTASLVEQYAAEPGMTDEKLELLCSMLVRAYDPCISCSVH